MAFDKLKLFGLQRTCTNLLLQSLCKSYRPMSIEEGYEWKHGYIGPAAEAGAAIVCSVKDPFAWLVSMYRFASEVPDEHGCPRFDHAWSFAEFLRQPHYSWPSPIHRWNELNAHYANWVTQHSEQGCLVHSERLMSLEGQAMVIREIGAQFGWQGDPATFPERVLHYPSDAHSAMDFDYYLRKMYLGEYAREDVRYVNGSLDQPLMQRLGYERAI